MSVCEARMKNTNLHTQFIASSTEENVIIVRVESNNTVSNEKRAVAIEMAVWLLLLLPTTFRLNANIYTNS